jgi:hypothetical protein
MDAKQRNCEQRQWVRFAWIGEHDGALRVNCRETSNDLTVEEINAACNCTIILSRMVRQGRNEWVKRVWDNRRP